jgi:hypothetical protein
MRKRVALRRRWVTSKIEARALILTVAQILRLALLKPAGHLLVAANSYLLAA